MTMRAVQQTSTPRIAATIGTSLQRVAAASLTSPISMDQPEFLEPVLIEAVRDSPLLLTSFRLLARSAGWAGIAYLLFHSEEAGSFSDEVNPITGKAYSSAEERDAIKALKSAELKNRIETERIRRCKEVHTHYKQVEDAPGEKHCDSSMDEATLKKTLSRLKNIKRHRHLYLDMQCDDLLKDSKKRKKRGEQPKKGHAARAAQYDPDIYDCEDLLKKELLKKTSSPKFRNDDFTGQTDSASQLLQAKLTVSTPGDSYEQEADQISDHVMRMPEPQVRRQCTCGKSSTDGECSDCKKKRKATNNSLQRVASSPTGGIVAPPIVDHVLSSSGSPLPTSTRSFMEARFNQDFSHVRVHTNQQASESAKAVQARAYTVGHNIVFGKGEHPSGDQRLLAHELTHVLQQGGGRGSASVVPPTVSRDVGWASRGPLPDPYGVGYNTILERAVKSGVPESQATQAIRDLTTLERSDLATPNLSRFWIMPYDRAAAVVALEPHAAGTAAEAWFSALKRATPTGAKDETTVQLDDPYKTSTSPDDPSSPVVAHIIPGQTSRVALIIGGIHQKTEPQGSEVVMKLKASLEGQLKAGKQPFFTTVLVPTVFAAERYGTGGNTAERRVKEEQQISSTHKSAAPAERLVETNRNYPLPGEDLATAQARGASATGAPELVFQPDDGTAVRAAKGEGTSTKMLPETRTLIALVEHFRPERLASIHAHSLLNEGGNAPGIFVDPRHGKAERETDLKLTEAMVVRGRKIRVDQNKFGRTDPFVGNDPDNARPSPYVYKDTPGLHTEGNSAGGYFPVSAGSRPGITTITVEVPQWKGAKNAANLDKIEQLDSDVLQNVFLEDPSKVTH